MLLLLNAKVGIFSLSYAVMPSFLVSVLFTDSYFIFNANVVICILSYAVMPSFLVSVLFINPYFTFKFINFNILVCSVF